MVKVVPEDLRTDAQTWEAFGSEDIAAGIQTVNGLNMPLFGYTVMGELVGVSSKYRDVQERVMSLMMQAPVASMHIATALRRSADIYEETDHQAEIEFNRID